MICNNKINNQQLMRKSNHIDVLNMSIFIFKSAGRVGIIDYWY